jgi:hypothetical protein
MTATSDKDTIVLSLEEGEFQSGLSCEVKNHKQYLSRTRLPTMEATELFQVILSF